MSILYAIFFIGFILKLHLNIAESKAAVHFGRCQNSRIANGFCRSIDDCPFLSSRLKNDPFLIDDLKCGSKLKTDLVCCPVVAALPILNLLPSDVLPQPPDCGRMIPNNKIFGGQETAIDEFPWMAIILYSESHRHSLCGGTLIATEWILTAGHCVHERNVRAVRLGEWNTETNPDCQESRWGGRDCAPAHVDIAVDFTRTSPDFQASGNYAHDIALLHLQVPVEFTDWIRPICLPPPASTDSNANTLAGVSMQIAGWGKNENTISGSKHMLKAPVTVWLKEACQNVFGQQELHERQICAGNTTGSCRGDSGGPMMQRKHYQVYQIGVISLGGNCMAENRPVIFTKVDFYVNWIADIIHNHKKISLLLDVVEIK